MANGEWKIGGTVVNAPRDWPNINIEVVFGARSTDTKLSITDVQLTGQAARIAQNHIDGGINGTSPGIFEGLPFSYTPPGLPPIEYLLDFGSYRQINSTMITVGLTKINNTELLFNRANGLTFFFLKEEGIIVDSDYVDVEYVFTKPFNFLESALLAQTLFLMGQVAADIIRTIANIIADGIGETAGGVIGFIGAAIMIGLKIIINLAFAAILVFLLIDMAEELTANLFGVKKKHRGIKWRTLFEKGFAHLGFTFESTWEPLDFIYLPSKTDDGKPLSISSGQQDGIPRDTDYGYTLGEQVKIAENACTAEFRIVGNVITMEPRNSPEWQTNTTFTYVPEIAEEGIVYNTGELVANILVTFKYDPLDEWTTIDSAGTSYQITTAAENQTTNPERETLKGLEEITLPVALASRKPGLNPLELTVQSIAQAIDNVVNALGGNSNLAGGIQNRVGMIRMSTPYNSVPKIIPLVDGKMPINHRDLWGAKAVWNNWISERSFVADNFRNQKRLFKDITIGMGAGGFASVVNNRFVFDTDGNRREINALSWNIGGDTAVVDTRYHEVYTENLKEVKNEG